jgi:16S rRNA processing protein RimM
MASATATLGSIVKAVGLKGELKLLPGPDFWTGALTAGDLDLVSAGGMRRAVRVERYRAKGNTFIIKFIGIESRDDAEPVVGSRLDISTISLAAESLPDELRPFQIMESEVRLGGGEPVGRVVDMLIGPAQRCLIIETDKGKRAVPLVPEVVVEVDLEAGVVVIDPPDGLLDIEW